jgi:hypothetical protein
MSILSADRLGPTSVAALAATLIERIPEKVEPFD